MIAHSNIETAGRARRGALVEMFPRANRKILIASALAALAALAMLSPAEAGQRPPAGARTASVGAVTAACDRTEGCRTTIEGGGVYGCSPNTCFQCNSSVCWAVPKPTIAKPRPGGPLPVGHVDALDKLLRRPTAIAHRVSLAKVRQADAHPIALAHTAQHSGHK